MTGFGSPYTAGIIAGGSTPPVTANTESWNGTNWTEVNNLNTARTYIAGCGPSSEGLIFGGNTDTRVGNTEEWNGTNWTEQNDLNTTVNRHGGAGTTTNALSFAGTPPVRSQTEEWGIPSSTTKTISTD